MKKVDAFLFHKEVKYTSLYIKVIILFCLCNLVFLLPDFTSIYGESSYVSPFLNAEFTNPIHPDFLWFTSLGIRLGIPISIGVILFLSIYFISLLLVFLDVNRVLFSIIALLMHVMLVNTSFFFSYGADYFITFSLLICVFLSFSKPYLSSFAIRLLQVQLCLVYFFAGFGKILGEDWWSGNAMWYVLNIYMVEYPISILPIFKYFFMLGSILIVLLELFYPILIWNTKLKKTILYLILTLHIGIALLMGLYTFGAIMILLNLVAWGDIHLLFNYLKNKYYGLKTCWHS